MIEFDHLTYSYPAAPASRASRATSVASERGLIARKPSARGSGDASWRLGGAVAVPVLHDISLRIDEGDFVLVIGPSGAGKSTLMRCINGLVPHFYGGTISGRIRVAGRDPVALEPRRMSDVVGFVFQDPEAQAVVDVVEDELAFAMENQGLPLNTMRKRVEEVLDQLNIAHLRRRKISTLSGGERQRVAIAAVLTLHPQVIVLDEPTSQLDPQAAEEVLDTLVKLNHDLGLTIVLSEHRLERVAQYADQILYLPGRGEPPAMGAPAKILAQVPLVPPLIELSKQLGWSPLPLTIKEARRFARRTSSARRLQGNQGLHAGCRRQEARGKMQEAGSKGQEARGRKQDVGEWRAGGGKRRAGTIGRGVPAIEVRNLRFAYNGTPVLRGIELTVQRGEFVAIMGRNGAGKSTLLKQCIGLLKPDEGQVHTLGLDTRFIQVEELARHVGYVPQNPNALLFADTVAEELAFTRRAQGMPPGAEPTAKPTEWGRGPHPWGHGSLLQALGLADMSQRYPRDLSAGERQRVALASVLVGDPELILLDEPTRGLDYEQKAALISFLHTTFGCRPPAPRMGSAPRGGLCVCDAVGLKRHGATEDCTTDAVRCTVVVATHDVELVAQCAERVVLMGDGEIVVDGPVREVMSDSQVFASQINKLFRDPRYLTVQDVVGASTIRQK